MAHRTTPTIPTTPTTPTSSPRLVYGLRPALEVLRARPDKVQVALLSEARVKDASLQRQLSSGRIAAFPRSAEALDALTQGGHHQGVVLVVGEYRYASLDGLLAEATATERPMVVLDQIQDPHNLGAILRSAYVLGVAGAVIPERRACPVTAAVVRTSAGASEHLPVCQVVNLGRALEALKGSGFWIFGCVGEGGEAPERLSLVGRSAFLLGSEGSGLRRSTREACDHLVTIPMHDPLSLNVSVAAGILFAEAARQRRASS